LIPTIDHLIVNELEKCPVLEAHEAVAQAFVSWLQVVCTSPDIAEMVYRDLYGADRSKSNRDHLLVELASLDERERGSRLILEWIFRIFRHHDLPAAEPLSRLPPAPGRAASWREAAPAVARAASQYPLDTALDFFALLAVRWARSCSLDDFNPFDDNPKGPGYHLPQGTDREAWITTFLLWSFEERFASVTRG